MLVPVKKCKIVKVTLVAVCFLLIAFAFAGPILAGENISEDIITEELISNDAGSGDTSPIVEGTTSDSSIIDPTAAIDEAETKAIASNPAKYGGTVKYTNGDPVEWDEIAGYIDFNENGAIDSTDLAKLTNPDLNKLFKDDSGDYTIGQYGLPLNNYTDVRPLIVNCPEDTACYGKPVLFTVKVGSVTYNASTTPAQVKWASTPLGYSKTRVDLTISSTPVTGIKGYVYLDTASDHSGTMVRVKQGSSTIATKFTDMNGKYEATGLSAGVYTLEFSNTSASWKKVTRSATVGTSGLTTVDVTMYLGDVNQDAAINFSDLLWLSRRIGSVPGQTLWEDLGDINNDNIINILDLLIVNQNIGK